MRFRSAFARDFLLRDAPRVAIRTESDSYRNIAQLMRINANFGDGAKID